jgi:hypothetical protein
MQLRVRNEEQQSVWGAAFGSLPFRGIIDYDRLVLEE